MTLPEGFRYLQEFLNEDEESALIAATEAQEFAEVRMHGVAARRRVIQYGWLYGFDRQQVEPGPETPEYLLPLRERAAALIETPPEDLDEVLVTRYPPGATIGWHRDAPMFGKVIGVSLAAPCRMRFRRGKTRAWETAEILLEPRSVYVLDGPARTQWQHSIPAVKQLRYSVTLRTLRGSHTRQARR